MRTALGRLVVPGALAVALLAAAGCGSSGVVRKPRPEPLKRVFVIVIENHSRNGVIGDPSAPRITALARRYGQATSYWSAYEESMPSAGYLGDYWPTSATPLYASKHNPFVFFDDIRSNPARLARIKPYDAHDLNGPERSIPDFAHIVPNQCHDMHGGVYTRVAADGSDGTPCPDGVALKRKADVFVGRTVRTIMLPKAWTGNSAIFVVGDESDAEGDLTASGGDFGGGLSPAVVIARLGPRHYASSTPYNHYSLLATIEHGWRLAYLGHAGDVAGGGVPMNDLLAR